MVWAKGSIHEGHVLEAECRFSDGLDVGGDERARQG